MIYSLTGKLILTTPEFCVVECGGVGYACKTTMNTLQQVSGKDSCTLYTYLAVREDAVELFGFATTEELDCFKLLTSVSGVGAKFAIAILSAYSPDKVALAIASEDVKTLTKCKGIGNKLAQRIVMELKDKIAKEPALMGSNAGVDFTPISEPNTPAAEAVEALVYLGYTQSEAATAVASLNQSLTSEEMIKQCLRILASGKF